MSRGWASVALRVALGVGRRPDLWVVALRQGARSVPRAWWRRRPFLPVPDRAYVGFRLETMYGGDAASARAALDVADVLRWLEWAKRR